MTTTTAPTANQTSIKKYAEEITKAVWRLNVLAAADDTMGSVVNTLDALTAHDGPLNALSEMLTEVASYLGDFEHPDADQAASWLEIAASNAAMATSTITSATDYIRDLAQ